MHYYMERVLYLTSTDSDLFLTFFEVAQLIKPVSAFFHPGIMRSVLRRLAGQKGSSR